MTTFFKINFVLRVQGFASTIFFFPRYILHWTNKRRMARDTSKTYHIMGRHPKNDPTYFLKQYFVPLFRTGSEETPKLTGDKRELKGGEVKEAKLNL